MQIEKIIIPDKKDASHQCVFLVPEGQEKGYYISTCNTYDRGWETMVFPAKRTDVAEKPRVSWGEDLYARIHDSKEDADKCHERSVWHFTHKLERGCNNG